MTYYKIYIWWIYSSKHWESHINNTYHHVANSQIRHLPQLILDPGAKISLHYTLKKCTLRKQISILLSYPNKLSPEHIKWKLVSDFSSKHCKSTLSNFTHDPYRTLIPHRGYTLHWKDHYLRQYILHVKKYKDISYEKIHLRDHKSI